MKDIQKAALGLIGNTKLVELGDSYLGSARILLKAEYLQPGGSMKDRNGLWAILGARKSGLLRENQVVVEATSGNMGAGVAIACACFGHPFIATMSSGNSDARAKLMEAFGAQVVRVPQVDGSPGRVTDADVEQARKAAMEIAENADAFYVDQWQNKDCIRAHYEGLAPELWRDTNGKIDAFCMVVGSGAAFTGTASYLKEHNKDIRCIAVEPKNCEPLGNGSIDQTKHKLQGAGYGVVPRMWQEDLLDGTVSVSDEEADYWKKRLATKEGLHVGYTSAANVCAAVKIAESGSIGRAPNIVTLLCDTGMKYD